MPPRVREVHVKGVRATTRVSLLNENRSECRDVNSIHTMFEIQGESDSDSWYLDPSAEQYGRVPGMTRVSEYPLEPWTERREQSLGTEYRLVVSLNRDLARQGYKTGEEFMCLTAAIYARVINNCVFKALKALGGAKVLWQAEDTEWERMSDDILRTVKQELVAVYHELAKILEDQVERRVVVRAQLMAISQFKEGHREFVKELER